MTVISNGGAERQA